MANADDDADDAERDRATAMQLAQAPGTKDSLSLQWVKMRNQINWSSLLEASIKFQLEESGGYKLREKKKKTSYTSVKLCSNFLIVATELQNMSGNATSRLQI